jgi:hypothetical protein
MTPTKEASFLEYVSTKVAAWAREDGREPAAVLEELRREVVKQNLHRMASRNRADMERLGLKEDDIPAKIAEYRSERRGR